MTHFCAFVGYVSRLILKGMVNLKWLLGMDSYSSCDLLANDPRHSSPSLSEFVTRWSSVWLLQFQKAYKIPSWLLMISTLTLISLALFLLSKQNAALAKGSRARITTASQVTIALLGTTKPTLVVSPTKQLPWHRIISTLGESWKRTCLRQIISFRSGKQPLSSKQAGLLGAYCARKSERLVTRFKAVVKEKQTQLWQRRFDSCMQMFKNAASICLQNGSFYLWAQNVAKDVMTGKKRALNSTWQFLLGYFK